MSEGRWWRWVALASIALLAGLLAAFNAGERVALNLGFTMLYRIPLVPLIFVVFLAGMTTMFLVGIRQDMRVRRALRDAGFGEPVVDRTRVRADPDGYDPDTTERYDSTLTEIPGDGIDGGIPSPPARPPEPEPPRDPP